MDKQRNIFSGLSWAFMERMVSQAAGLAVTVILARLLAPEAYGTIALVRVFITLANVFVQNGIGVSLIQDRCANKKDFSTISYISLVTGLILLAVMYICAPFIASYYHNPDLIVYIRVLSAELPIVSVYTIFHAIVSRRMQFHKLFISTISSSILSGTVGIVMALHNFGIWALIWRELLGQLFNAVILGGLVRWRPELIFSKESAARHFSYSIRITLATLLNTIASQFQTLAIGRMYTSADLAFYEQGQKYPEILANNITGSFDSVMFPVIANTASDMRSVSGLILKSVRLSSFIVVPMMVGFAAVAETVVHIFLTDVWLPCVPYLRIVCISIYFFL